MLLDDRISTDDNFSLKKKEIKRKFSKISSIYKHLIEASQSEHHSIECND